MELEYEIYLDTLRMNINVLRTVVQKRKLISNFKNI